MRGRCVCGDWDCGYHGEPEDYAQPELCKHCDKPIHRPGFTFWMHIDGTRFCHQSLNDDCAEPR